MNDFLNVMDVERFATKDGPGIRTVVFLKGCPLHCPWCANPESQSAAQQLLHFANKCTACGTCAAVCAQGAPQLVSGKKPQFDRAKCTACGLCAQSCPAGALRLCGAMRTQQSVLAEVLRDQDYYTASNGGVTISGGEPLLQTDALVVFLALCKERGLHTAVETCGVFSSDAMMRCAPLLDLFLFDIKCADAARLMQATGAQLAVVRDNLCRAVASGCEVIVRVPVIPGFNHDRESMRAVFALALQCGAQQVDLLPYHTLGAGKYAALGQENPLSGTPMLEKKALAPWRELAVEMGLHAEIGG